MLVLQAASNSLTVEVDPGSPGAGIAAVIALLRGSDADPAELPELARELVSGLSGEDRHAWGDAAEAALAGTPTADDEPATAAAAASLGRAGAAVLVLFRGLLDALEVEDEPAYLGSDDHLDRIRLAVALGPETADGLAELLTTCPSLDVRFDALRVARLANARRLAPCLQKLKERRVDTMIQPRVRALLRMWDLTPRGEGEVSPIVRLSRDLEAIHWFELPGVDLDEIRARMEALAELGDLGLFRIQLFLGRLLDERCPTAPHRRPYFRIAAQLFADSGYYEGIEPLFDFLDDCRPGTPDPDLLSLVGQILKATRALRPYRNPEWAGPLVRFAKHFKSINQPGRAAEARMVALLIGTEDAESALVLEDDELVDLLRGRRDSAYTLKELDEVAALTQAVIDAGREDARILHIRGWLAGRLEGEEQARRYFLNAVDADQQYAPSLVALASLSERQGDELARDRYLEAACAAESSLVSCHRKWANILERRGELELAVEVYGRGTITVPEGATDLELEDLFGCFAGQAGLLRYLGDTEGAIEVLEEGRELPIETRFPSWFVHKQGVVISLLRKGLDDLKTEILRESGEG